MALMISSYAKSLVAQSTYSKGKAFVAAAILLRQNDGYEYVVLHLICQGLELIFKSMLMQKDYDKFRPKKLKSKYGHDLEKVARRALREHNLNPLNLDEAKELAALNNLFAQHLLRYGSMYDILVDSKTIASGLMLQRLHSLIPILDAIIIPKPVAAAPAGPPAPQQAAAAPVAGQAPAGNQPGQQVNP
jgi:hypothetical protein